MDIIDIKTWLLSISGKYDKRQVTGVFYCKELHSYIVGLKNTNLWISVHPKYPYIDIADSDRNCPRHNLSDHLKDMYISGFTILNLDVVLEITLTHKYLPSQQKYLYFEMQRNKTNLILTDKDKRILYVHREVEDKRYGRMLWGGSIYTPPPIEGTYSIEDIPLLSSQEHFILRGIAKERRKYFSLDEIYTLWQSIRYGGDTKELDSYLHVVKPSEQSVIGLFYEHYITSLEIEHQKAIQREKDKKLRRERKRLEKLLSKLEKELQSTEDFEKYKKYGDGILTYLHHPIYEKTFTFTDWETGENVTVPIEPGKDPKEMATHYYKKYKHLKKKRENVIRRIEEVKRQIEHLELKTDEDEEATQHVGKPYMKFEDEYGNIYLVGKNQIGNHIVSFHLASKKHLWFHVKDFPGSHVILKPKDGVITEYAIITAAKLASYFSKMKDSSKVEVIYTERKNIKPVKGEIGLAIYRGEKSILVAPESPEEMEMKRLL
ncbi:DUF814 domain-containing protein [bacterium 3DAC]|nr:DUF814 domain-containing protein [bacterium 3DAC]